MAHKHFSLTGTKEAFVTSSVEIQQQARLQAILSRIASEFPSIRSIVFDDSPQQDNATITVASSSVMIPDEMDDSSPTGIVSSVPLSRLAPLSIVIPYLLAFMLTTQQREKRKWLLCFLPLLLLFLLLFGLTGCFFHPTSPQPNLASGCENTKQLSQETRINGWKPTDDSTLDPRKKGDYCETTVLITGKTNLQVSDREFCEYILPNSKISHLVWNKSVSLPVGTKVYLKPFRSGQKFTSAYTEVVIHFKSLNVSWEKVS